MDIVKCPNSECNAEQAIWIDRDGDVACAFCGTKITELPEGVDLDSYRKQAQDRLLDQPIAAAYDDAAPVAAPEGKGDAVCADFSLEYAQVEQALYKADRINPSKSRQIIFTVLLALMFCLEVYQIITQLTAQEKQPFPTMPVILMIMIAFMIPYLWISPKKQLKKYIESIADGTVLNTIVFEDLLRIKAENSDKSTKVKLDGQSAELIETEDLLLLSVKETGSLVVLPKSAFGEQLETVRERLTAGTTPYVPLAERKAKKSAPASAESNQQ